MTVRATAATTDDWISTSAHAIMRATIHLFELIRYLLNGVSMKKLSMNTVMLAPRNTSPSIPKIVVDLTVASNPAVTFTRQNVSHAVMAM